MALFYSNVGRAEQLVLPRLLSVLYFLFFLKRQPNMLPIGFGAFSADRKFGRKNSLPLVLRELTRDTIEDSYLYGL